MEAVEDQKGPSIHSLPTELLTKIASHLAPSLHRGWLPATPGRQFPEWKRQHAIITALQLTNRRFAAICRPLVWRSVCFSADDSMRAGPATLMKLEDVHQVVKEVRWEYELWTYSDMQAVFLDLLPNLTSVSFLVFESPGRGGGYPLQVPQSIMRSLKGALHLTHLGIEAFNLMEGSFNIDAELPDLRSLTITDSMNHDAWKEAPRKASDVTFVYDFDGQWFDWSEEMAFCHYLPIVESLTFESYSSTDTGTYDEGRTVLDHRVLSEIMGEIVLGETTADQRASMPIKQLELRGLILFDSVEMLDFLKTLADTEALETLRFTHCAVSKAIAPPANVPWSQLQMPHVRSVVISMAFAPATSLSLRSFLAAFPNLIDVDISDVLAPRVLLSSPLDTLAGTPAEVVTLLKFAREETDNQRLIIRFTSKNELLRCRREEEGEAEAGSYGWARELWREW